MGNSLATLVLFLAPIAVIMLFRRLPVAQACAISLVGGYLLLPTKPSFDLPFFPSYGKNMAVILPVMLMAILATKKRSSGRPMPGEDEIVQGQPGWLPRSPLIRMCFIGLLLSPFVTALGNGDPLVYPLRTVPSFGLYDATAASVAMLFLILPFLVARKFLAGPEDHKTLLAVLCVATLLYSLPTLWEIRMSPRLNSQIYGFFAHDWRQHLRSGGYRPVVFLEHGLRLGLFLSVGIMAIAITARISTGRLSRIAPFGVFWLFAVIAISKNLGALIIVLLILPAALLLRPRGQLLFAAILAGLVLFYPMMRAANMVPLDSIRETIASFADEDRVASMNFRLNNEEVLLERARERPLGGWGGWGRARAKDEMGRDASTTDGIWIIIFGEGGWFGYLARFGLLTLPVLLLAKRRSKEDIPLATSGLALLLAANLVDLIPNSALTPVTWILAGALAGRLETVQATSDTQPQRRGVPPPRDAAPDPGKGRRAPPQGSRDRPVTPRTRAGLKPPRRRQS